MKNPVTCLITLFLLGSSLNLSFATTYKWTDETGNTVYSQQPPAEGTPYTKMDKLHRSGSPRYSKPASTEPSASTNAAKKSIKDSEKSSASRKKVDTEVAKAAEIRKQNCAAAKENLEIYTVYRRIKDKQGNVTYIDDNVRQQKINQAKQAIQDFCE